MIHSAILLIMHEMYLLLYLHEGARIPRTPDIRLENINSPLVSPINTSLADVDDSNLPGPNGEQLPRRDRRDSEISDTGSRN